MNAARTLQRTVEAIPRDFVDEVDPRRRPLDRRHRRRSRATLPISLVWHPHNAGYGANQKTCYLEALQRDADVVVMLHPDGQYEPELIPDARARRSSPASADLVLGSRFAAPGMARAHGMPRWKYLVNRCLTTVENEIMGTRPDRGRTPATAPTRASFLLTSPSCATPTTSASTPRS